MSAPLARISKDPVAVKPYIINFAGLLDPGDMIQTAVWTVPTGLVKGAEDIIDNGTAARVWISGGVLDTVYEVTCRITTVGGLQDKRTLEFEVVEE